MSSNTKVEEFSFISSFSLTENVSKLEQNFSTQLISEWLIVVSSKYGVLQTLKEIRYIFIKRLRTKYTPTALHFSSIKPLLC